MVYLVRSGTRTRCAKVYRDMAQRSFQKRARYQAGRKMRGSRQTRAIATSTRFGRREQEAALKNAEVDALHKLVAAGVLGVKPLDMQNLTGTQHVSTPPVAGRMLTMALDRLYRSGERV